MSNKAILARIKEVGFFKKNLVWLDDDYFEFFTRMTDLLSQPGMPSGYLNQICAIFPKDLPPRTFVVGSGNARLNILEDDRNRCYTMLAVLKEQFENADPTKNAGDKMTFRFAKTLTDFSVGNISSEDDAERNQGLNKSKKRYLWEFLAKHYGTRQPRSEADRFVQEKLKRPIAAITKKDFENLIDTVLKISSLPPVQVRKCFIFGDEIGLEKIG